MPKNYTCRVTNKSFGPYQYITQSFAVYDLFLRVSYSLGLPFRSLFRTRKLKKLCININIIATP